MANTVISIDGAGAAPPTLLGQGPARIATGGKIRAGIKVLTKKAAESAQAREIYEQGVAAGLSFDQIEQQLADALPNLRMPLAPKNVAWFTVRAQDFPNPELARQILEAYGEDRGDGIRRLYRFPVVFPSDIWQTVMPHELVAWGAHERKFWSEYAPDGKTRYCKCYAPPPLVDNGRRVVRLFGGRKTTLRGENGGLCDPEGCGEYQQRQCNLSGRFIFFMPGIRSISAFELHTNSFYAMNAAIQKFETIAFMRGGRISGFLDAQHTPFFITKKVMEVPHIDELGRAVRVRQWIIELEAPVDVTALLRAQDDDETVLVGARMASQILQGTVPEHSPIAASLEERHLVVGEPDLPRTNAEGAIVGAAEPAEGAELRTTERCDQADCAMEQHGGGASQMTNKHGPNHAQIIDAIRSYGIDEGRYGQYADLRWGSGWKLNRFGRLRAWEEVQRHSNDAQGYLDKIDAELKLFHDGVPRSGTDAAGEQS